MEEQLARVYENFLSKPAPLDKFVYMTSLHDRNETLFFRLVHERIDEMLPIVYTPVVGEACQKFSHIYRRGRGLYISYEQRNDIEKVLRNYHTTDPSVIVVTDGERILGLGDQGAGGMGIPIGKLCLYTTCAGVSPYSTLPITLDVGTDNEERLKDPLYLGLRHKRIRGPEYQDFIDRFVAAVKKVYPDVLLQWEDFLKGNAIKQLDRFRHSILSFNDDIQGTAAVVLAGIYSAMRITGQPMRDQRLVFAGAGASTHGIAALFVSALVEDGLSAEEARRRVWTVDTKGLVVGDRPGLEDFKALYAREAAEVASWKVRDRSRITLEETVANAKPTILIGVSATPGNFTESLVKLMAKLNERPLVFPLSNPDVEERVHSRRRHPMVGRARPHRHGEPLCAGDLGRADVPDRAVQQRVRLPRCRARGLRRARPVHQRRDVPRRGQGARGEGHGRGPGRVRRLPEALPDPGLLPRRRLRRRPAGGCRGTCGPGHPPEPRRDRPAGDVVPRVPPHPLRAGRRRGPRERAGRAGEDLRELPYEGGSPRRAVIRGGTERNAAIMKSGPAHESRPVVSFGRGGKT